MTMVQRRKLPGEYGLLPGLAKRAGSVNMLQCLVYEVA